MRKQGKSKYRTKDYSKPYKSPAIIRAPVQSVFPEEDVDCLLRLLQLAISHNRREQAMQHLKDFFEHHNTARDRGTHVADVGLPPRVYERLERAGYVNLGSLMEASDGELKEIPGIDLLSLTLIRTVTDEFAMSEGSYVSAAGRLREIV